MTVYLYLLLALSMVLIRAVVRQPLRMADNL
jgi:hypothetical protein